MGTREDDQFGQLYESTRHRLAAQIYGLTGDRHEAAEIVQEAFVRAWSRWSSVQGLNDPEAWVRKVAFRLAVSRWRRLQRLKLLSGQTPPQSTEPVGDRVDVMRVLRDLPPNLRQAIVLHYLAALSVEEIAGEMGCPSGTVKSWLSRARHRIGEQLGDALSEPVVQQEVP